MPDFFSTFKVPDVLDAAQQQLSLIDLQNRIANAPVENKIKQLDAALKSNELIMTDIENDKKRWDLVKAKNDEARAQTNFFFENAKSLPGLFNLSFDLGAAAASRMGMAAVQQENGTIGLAIPNANGGALTITLDPKRIGDPEKIADSEKQIRNEWVKAGENFRIVDENYRTLLSATEVKTGIGDLTAIVAYAKIIDPGSVVREGEVDRVVNTTNLPEWLKAMYRRQVNVDAPTLTPMQRQSLVYLSGERQKLNKTNLTALGRHYYDIAQISGWNPKKVLVPIGSLQMKDFISDEPALGETQIPEAPAMPSVLPQKPEAQGAAAIPGIMERSALEQMQKAKFKTTDELLKNNLFKGYTGGQ